MAAAASVGSAVYGAVNGAIEGRRSERALQRKRANEAAWYDRARYESPSQRSEYQFALSSLRDAWKERSQAEAGRNIVTGASQDAAAAVKAQQTKAEAEAQARMAAGETLRKDQLDAQHQKNLEAFDNEQAALHTQRAQNIAAAAGGASSAMGSVAAAAAGQKMQEDKLRNDYGVQVAHEGVATPPTVQGTVPVGGSGPHQAPLPDPNKLYNR